MPCNYMARYTVILECGKYQVIFNYFLVHKTLELKEGGRVFTSLYTKSIYEGHI